MEVDKEKEKIVDILKSLSDQLTLNSLWDNLAETPANDHHAVVLQV